MLDFPRYTLVSAYFALNTLATRFQNVKETLTHEAVPCTLIIDSTKTSGA